MAKIKRKNFFLTIWDLLVSTYNEFIDDKALKMAAALSYYAAFSIGPLLIIVIAIAGFFFGEDAAEGQLKQEITGLLGSDGAALVQTIIKGAADQSSGIFAAVVSVVLLILGSVGVFLELQESLNIIWGVELRPGRGIWGFIKNRLVSFSMVVTIGFLLMISLIINSIISLLNNYIGEAMSAYLPFAEILNIISSFAVITLLFAIIYRVLPDVIIPWKYVWFGAALTSFLFSIGKYFIGLYLGNSSYSSTYGAAASLVILFVWVYYSGLILFFGAELTQVYFKKHSSLTLKPDSDGILVPKVSQLIKNWAKRSSGEVSG
jgi:membrane protein